MDEAAPKRPGEAPRRGRRPPPRAGCRAGGQSENAHMPRAIMTIGEDQVISYVDEESDEIERMLQAKRSGQNASDSADVAPHKNNVDNITDAEAEADGVDPQLVMSALESLLGSKLSEIEPKCTKSRSQSFYESEDGNDALAAGMFDISVVCAELDGAETMAVGSADGVDSGIESSTMSIDPSPPSDGKSRGSDGGDMAHASLEILSPIKIDDGYRPRTSSQAPDPDDMKTNHSATPTRTSSDVQQLPVMPVRSLHVDELKTDATYRPRTSSDAPEPDFDVKAGPHATQRSPAVPRQLSILRVDDTYRPRTSSKAIEPENVA